MIKRWPRAMAQGRMGGGDRPVAGFTQDDRQPGTRSRVRMAARPKAAIYSLISLIWITGSIRV
jgi:hypothetical protein